MPGAAHARAWTCSRLAALRRSPSGHHGMEEVRGSSPLSSTHQAPSQAAFRHDARGLVAGGSDSCLQSAYQRALPTCLQAPQTVTFRLSIRPCGNRHSPATHVENRQIDRLGEIRKRNPHLRLGLVNHSTYPAPVASILQCLLGGTCRFQPHHAPGHMAQVDLQRSFMRSRSPSVRCCSTGGRH
jgi:hypothetical protein